MSHSSSSSCGSASLLQRNRPNYLPPQPITPPLGQSTEQRQYLETHESRHLPEAFRSRSNSNATPPEDLQPVPSTSSGVMYLNVDPTFSTSTDIAHPDRPSHASVDCCSQLAALKAGIIGEAVPKDQWQPDSSSALCTFPFCTTIFASTSYFSLGPRRHHCRKCGKLYCASHSSRRALMYDESHNLVKERVCDMCVGVKEDGGETETLGRRRSNASEVTTDVSDNIVTPNELVLSRCSTRSILPQTPLATSPSDHSLAPIEGWMDKDGVLSLYPLAHPPTNRQSVLPAAGPLFAPSKKALRDAREREQGLTLRQRRLGERETELKWSRSPDAADEHDESDTASLRGTLPPRGLLRQRSGNSRSPHSRERRRRIAY